MPVSYTNEDRSGAGQIASLLTGTNDEMIKQQERQRKEAMDQIVMYNQLREAGYSPDDARAKSARLYRSQGLFDMLLKKKQPEMTVPTGEDKWTREERLKKLEEKKLRLGFRETQAGIREKQSKTKYNEALAKGEILQPSGHYDPEGNWIPGQPRPKGAVSDLPPKGKEEDPFDKLYNETPSAEPTQATGQRVPMTRPDGTWVLVKPEKVQLKLSQGYKNGHIQ